MSSKYFRNKNIQRPRKSVISRRRRDKVHRRRLVALGMPEAEVMSLDTKTLREYLKYPAKTVKMLAKRTA